VKVPTAAQVNNRPPTTGQLSYAAEAASTDPPRSQRRLYVEGNTAAGIMPRCRHLSRAVTSTTERHQTPSRNPPARNHTHCQQRPHVPGNITQGLRLRPPTDVLCYYLQRIPTLRNEENKWGEPTADSAGHPTLTKHCKLPRAERASSCPPCQTISLQLRVPQHAEVVARGTSTWRLSGMVPHGTLGVCTVIPNLKKSIDTYWCRCITTL
jgi:hypothetical protein